MLKFVSFFSGIGGFDLGFHQAGMECVGQVEKDKNCLKLLDMRFPNVPKWEDIKDVTGTELPDADVWCGGFPCTDVSRAGRRAGLAGSESGLWFEFHRLIHKVKPSMVVVENVDGLFSSNGGKDFAVVVGGLTGWIPEVPDGGWKSSGAIRGYAGQYHVIWRLLDSQFFGVAQRRKRVFIVASLTERGGSFAEVLFERQSSAGHSVSGGKTGETIAATVTSRIGKGGFTDPVNDNVIVTNTISANHSPDRGDGTDNFIVFMGGQGAKAGSIAASDTTSPTLKGSPSGTNQVPVVSGTLGAAHGGNRDLGQANETDLIVAFDHKASASVDQPVRSDGKVGTLQTNKQDAVLIGISTELTTLEDTVPALTQPSVSDGGHPAMVVGVESIDDRNSRSNGDISGTLQSKQNGYSLSYQNPIAEYYSQDYNQDRIYNPDGTAPAHTAAQPAGGRKFNTQSGVRRLTPIETARLQGFPDDWMQGFSDSAQYRAYGNAVTVSVARWIAERIVRFWHSQGTENGA